PHDNDPVPEIPGIVPDRDEMASYQRHNPGKSAKGKDKEQRSAAAAEHKPSRGGTLWAIAAGAVALCAVGWAGYLHQQLLAAELRVVALEERLSSTDASVNQSSVALQVKLNEVDAAVRQLADETLKRYKTTLDHRGAQIDALDKSFKTAKANTAKLYQRIDEHDKALDAARAQIDKVTPIAELSRKKIDEHQAALNTLTGRLKTVGDNQVKLDARLSDNEEWVESINAFRMQMNREIVNIKQQVAGGKASAAPL